nr:hypothetical protein [Ktedonobacter sp. SOSP1-52]
MSQQSCPFHDPALALDLKGSLWFANLDGLPIDEHPIRLRLTLLVGDDFDLPSKMFFEPVLKGLSIIAMIGKQMRERRETLGKSLSQEAGASHVGDSGCKHSDGQQKALRINQNAPFASQDFFPGIVATFDAWDRTGLAGLAIDDSGGFHSSSRPIERRAFPRKAFIACSHTPAFFHWQKE